VGHCRSIVVGRVNSSVILLVFSCNWLRLRLHFSFLVTLFSFFAFLVSRFCLFHVLSDLWPNIVWSAGSITSAVKLAKKAAGFSSKIEVECRSIEEANEAASAGCDIGEAFDIDADGLIF